VQLRIFTEPQQGATYDDLLAVAQATERLGFDAFFRSDHYLGMGPGLDRGGMPGPTDAWVTLAGLARDTERIRLGTLVTPVTFRLPGPLAISVAGVDQMSGGRIELGLGAGWFDREHTAYGIPFPEVKKRFDRLEEQLAIVTGLWSTPLGETFSFAGEEYVVEGSPALPKPVQDRIPVIVGGGGPKRTPRLAATYATEFNLSFKSREFGREQLARVDAACEKVGRDPRDLVHSAALVTAVGADDAEVDRRLAAIGHSREALASGGGLVGTPADVRDELGHWSELGVTRVYLQILDLGDLEHLDLIAAEVLPHV
jgi:F420-dependent oxidoreductase-like protein